MVVHPQVAIMNESTCLTDEQVRAILPALQKQIDRDFAPVWGVSAELVFVPHGEATPGGAWWLVFLDNPDQAGLLGYHDLNNGGLPLGKVFAKSDIDKGQKWTVTASHELLEMLVDPSINLTVIVQPDSSGGLLYPYEVCDPCEADEHGYDIDGVTVADFVYPSWFEPFRPAGTRFDHQNKIQKPFQLLPGGYIGVYDLSSGSGWHQQNAQTDDPRAYQMRPQPGSRRERRRVPGSQWMKSIAKRDRQK
jgi:hypothetical protein